MALSRKPTRSTLYLTLKVILVPIAALRSKVLNIAERAQYRQNFTKTKSQILEQPVQNL